MLTLAMPRVKRGQKFAFSFDEDEVTLAWDAVKSAALAPGAHVAATGIELPAWWWKGTGLTLDAEADILLLPVPTMVGPSLAVQRRGATPDVELEARARYAAAATRSEAEWQKHRLAREGPDSEADFPLGAYVLPMRHDEVTAERMQLPAGVVASWTTVSPGAAPTEFMRLQEAVGAFHVVLVEFEKGRRTVGVWAEATPPRSGQSCRPVLRRLFRMQGAWRHGVKFAPS